jgi:hypothetical protein
VAEFAGSVSVRREPVLCQTLIPGFRHFWSSVISAQAGIQRLNLDSRLRGNDMQTLFSALTEHLSRFFDTISTQSVNETSD